MSCYYVAFDVDIGSESMTQLTKELGGERYLAQIGRLCILLGTRYEEAVRLYKRGYRVRRDRVTGKLVPYRARKRVKA